MQSCCTALLHAAYFSIYCRCVFFEAVSYLVISSAPQHSVLIIPVSLWPVFERLCYCSLTSVSLLCTHTVSGLIVMSFDCGVGRVGKMFVNDFETHCSID